MAAFENDCRSFYHALRSHYPNAKMIGISPVWRKDADEEAVRSVLERVTETISTVCREVNAVYLHGWELIPEQETLFGDGCLHPGNEGFDCFFENMVKQL